MRGARTRVRQYSRERGLPCRRFGRDDRTLARSEEQGNVRLFGQERAFFDEIDAALFQLHAEICITGREESAAWDVVHTVLIAPAAQTLVEGLTSLEARSPDMVLFLIRVIDRAQHLGRMKQDVVEVVIVMPKSLARWGISECRATGMLKGVYSICWRF